MPRLNAPTILIFLLSLILAIFAVVHHMAPQIVIQVKMDLIPHQPFWAAVGAYVLLMLGNLIRGL